MRKKICQECSNGCTNLDETWVSSPSVDDTPLDVVPHFASFAFPKQFVQAASCRAAAVLGILRKRDGPFHAVLLHLTRGLVRQRFRVTERDVKFVGSCLGVQFIQQGHHACALQLGVPQNRGTASDICILFLDLRGSSAG